jgi:UMF1 family MFS transporter
VFYNAMLPDLAPPGRVGRISGWAWGLGYFGGLVCLMVALFGFVRADPPPFGLDAGSYEHVRATTIFVALWFVVFALPLFLWVPDRPRAGIGSAAAIRKGLAALMTTLRRLPHYRNIARFLIAKMIYIDGLNTLFTFGGIYAAGTFGMSLEEVLVFGILLNITAGSGAALFAWVDDWIGAKRTIMLALLALIVLGVAALLVEDKALFYAIGLGLGIFFGPAQAASRSLMARLAPPDLATEFFGLYALAGKATAFMGPALFGWATLAAGSQRAGMATILIFFVVGLVLLMGVKEPKGLDDGFAPQQRPSV